MKKYRALGTNDRSESKCPCLQSGSAGSSLLWVCLHQGMLQEPSSGAAGTLGAAEQAMDGLRGGHMRGQLAVVRTAGLDLLSGSLDRFYPAMPACQATFWPCVLCGFLPQQRNQWLSSTKHFIVISLASRCCPRGLWSHKLYCCETHFAPKAEFHPQIWNPWILTVKASCFVLFKL